MHHNHHDHLKRARRETLRWLLLFVLEQFPAGCNETALKYMVELAEGLSDLKRDELRAALLYLRERELVAFEDGDHIIHWHAKLTRCGFDVAQYAVACEPGIARPSKD